MQKKSFKKSLHNFFHEKIRPEIVILKMIIKDNFMIMTLGQLFDNRNYINHKYKHPRKSNCKKIHCKITNGNKLALKSATNQNGNTLKQNNLKKQKVCSQNRR